MPQCPVDIDQVLRQTFVAEIEHHATLGSTNDLAKLRSAQQGRRLPLLILADEQTAGRGRGTNRWWTGRGSLALSLLVDTGKFGIAPRHSPLVGLAAAVAVVEAVAPRLPGRTVGLHWPNDVYAEGRKLAGILAELLAGGRCVIGIGVNTNNSVEEAPPELRQSAATLLDLTGKVQEQTEILVAILHRLEECLRQLVEQPARVGRRADVLCLQHGRELTLDLGDRAFTGCCAGIDGDGGLLLDTSAGRRKFFSGVLRAGSPHS